MKYILSLIFFFSFISISVGAESSKIKDSSENNILLKDEQIESFNESKIVKKLINNSVDIYGPNKDNNKRLHLAAFNGDYQMVKLLLDNGADIDCQNKVKSTPLLYAAQEGHDEVIQLLIERGANLEHQDSGGRTSLLLASGFSNKESIVNKLLESGANINHQDKDKNTAIHWGAFNGCYEIVKLLLESGDDIHKKGNFGCTPICDAAQEGQDEIIQLLFDKGANLEDQDRLGRTPLLLAVKFSKKESTVNKLLKLGPNINHIDKNKKTALHYAVINRNDKLVELLLEYGADPTNISIFQKLGMPNNIRKHINIIQQRKNIKNTHLYVATKKSNDEVFQLKIIRNNSKYKYL